MSNLPPGVTDNMIPGNRPEDMAWDDFCERALEQLANSGLSVDEAMSAVQFGIALAAVHQLNLEELGQLMAELATRHDAVVSAIKAKLPAR